MSNVPVLRITGLSKRFGGQPALDQVGLELADGEIRGLIGENGAGKSTLIKLLAGIYIPDSGSIEIDGRPVYPHLHHAPIAFVHQDLGLVDELSVGENIAFTLGFPTRGPLIDWKAVWFKACEVYEKMGLIAPPAKTPVGRLLPAEKALLGIVRALAANAAVAVLDEPTVSLPAPDVRYVLDALLNLRKTGTPILYVTHRLQELHGVVDTVTVLRGGKKVAEGPIANFTVEALIENMLGRPIAERETATAGVSKAAPIVTVRDVEVGGARVSLNVFEGEILGLVGLSGAGHERIGRALAGDLLYRVGQVSVRGISIPATAKLPERMSQGIGLLPADRQRESTLPGMSLVENLFPGPHNRSGFLGWIAHSREKQQAAALLDTYDVRPCSPALPIDQLSGGNQQKVVAARVLHDDLRLVVLEEPTAGVDVGSKFEIHEIIRKASAGGCAVIVVSSDFEEVTQLCTRVLVVVNGAIEAEVVGTDITEGRLTILSSAHAVPATVFET